MHRDGERALQSAVSKNADFDHTEGDAFASKSNNAFEAYLAENFSLWCCHIEWLQTGELPMKKQILAAAFTSLVALSAMSSAQAQVIVRVGPPAPIVETIPAPPPEHPGWAWHNGYHRWDGARYVWVPGYYAQPPHPGGRWIEGHWVNHGGGYVWREGHWG